MDRGMLEARRVAAEWGLILGLGAIYTLVRAWATPGDPTVAVANTQQIVALEESLGLLVEAGVQAALLGHGWLLAFLNQYYVLAHLPPILGALVYTYVRHPDAWPLVRNVAVAFTVVGGIIHVLYPVAPPWFIEGNGIFDTLQDHGPDGWKRSGLGNPLAAMPSMHWGWALIAGGAVAWLGEHLVVRVAGVAHPLIMAVAIVATGNHYILDAVASLVLVAATLGVMVGWQRLSGQDGPGPPHGHPPGSLVR